MPEEEVSLTVMVTEPESLVGIRVVEESPNCPELSNGLTEEEVRNPIGSDGKTINCPEKKKHNPFVHTWIHLYTLNL